MNNKEYIKEFIYFLRKSFKRGDDPCTISDLANMGDHLMKMLVDSKDIMEAVEDLEKNPIFGRDDKTGEWDELPPTPENESVTKCNRLKPNTEMVEGISPKASKDLEANLAKDMEYIKMVEGINPELLGPAEMIDKDTTTYFMTQMTQEEFDKRTGDSPIVSHEFNKIKS